MRLRSKVDHWPGRAGRAGSGPRDLLPAFGLVDATSVSTPNCWQAGHLPSHLVVRLPHSLHWYSVLDMLATLSGGYDMFSPPRAGWG